MKFFHSLLCCLTWIAFALPCVAADAARKPTVFLIGDSTVKNGDKGLMGWGSFLAEHLDLTKVTVSNRALGGRSSRSFLREGLWEKVLGDVQAGDFLLIQFGHNDRGPIDKEKARASLKGNGDEEKEVTIQETGAKETVHSHGWYLRKYATDAQAKGAVAIICSQIPRNIWTNGKVGRADADYGKWAAEAAAGCKAQFLPLNKLIADQYDELGAEKVGEDYFTTTDHTHTTEAGAKLNAACVAMGIRQLKDCPLAQWLRPE